MRKDYFALTNAKIILDRNITGQFENHSLGVRILYKILRLAKGWQAVGRGTKNRKMTYNYIEYEIEEKPIAITGHRKSNFS